MTALAAGPEYTSLRKLVEDQNPKDKTPTAERIFMNHDWKESAVVHYHKGMTLQEVLNQVKFRDTFVSVYRAGHKPTGQPVYNEADMDLKPDRKAVAVQPLDVIYFWNGNRN
jgi:hypothetical protein